MRTRYNSPQEAETAFYLAFEHKDHATMKDVWAQTDDIVCIHPMGSALQGAHAVNESWRAIFSGEMAMNITLEPVRSHRTESMAVHIVIEHIALPDGKKVAPMLSTNIYRETAEGWHMILHHAAPAPDYVAEHSDEVFH